ncbi:hypothetical protein ACFFP0_25115 [Rhizobium puerariae]|uniref:Antifreeze protein n=1 Tax=Rhizobium puerariae TaxID=1585791 RepID=A0ABV6AND7_9HYPH
MKAKHMALLAGMSALFVGMSMLPGPAVAQVVQFDLDDGGVRVMRPDDYERRYYRRDDRRDDWRGERRYSRPGCSPGQALNAATRYLYDPRIRSANRRYYYIDGYGKSGRRRGHPDDVRISTGFGCDRV